MQPSVSWLSASDVCWSYQEQGDNGRLQDPDKLKISTMLRVHVPTCVRGDWSEILGGCVLPLKFTSCGPTLYLLQPVQYFTHPLHPPPRMRWQGGNMMSLVKSGVISTKITAK